MQKSIYPWYEQISQAQFVSYRNENSSIIDLDDKQSMELTVRKNQQFFQLIVQKNSPIGKAKAEACKQFKVDQKQYMLHFAGNRLEQLNNFADYRIRQNNILQLISQKMDSPIHDTILFDSDQQLENEINIKFVYGQKYVQSNSLFQNIDQIRIFCSNSFQIQNPNQINFFYQNKFIYNNEQLQKLKLSYNSEILIVLDSEGGSILKYNQIINQASLNNFQLSIQPLIGKSSNNLKLQLKKISKFNIKQQQKALLASINTQFLIRVNNQLKSHNNNYIWKQYLKLVQKGFNKLQRFIGISYRCIKSSNQKIIQQFKQGSILSEKDLNISTTTDQKPKKLCIQSQNNILIQIHGTSGRKLPQFNFFPDSQNLILFLPYTYFELIQIKNIDNKYYHIILNQLPALRGNKILFWVDDEPIKNKNLIQKAQKQYDYSVVLAKSTHEALFALQKFSYLLKLNKTTLKVITDMVRIQNNIINYYAGIDLIQKIYLKNNLTMKILIFCGDKKRGIQNCKKRGLQQQLFNFRVINNINQVIEFIRNEQFS